jgi:hypothetical protein
LQQSVSFLLLIVSVPPKPSSLRVKVWRRLRALGAVALKRTVYLLPDTGDHHEQLQWLAQDVQRDGGEATLVRVDRIENLGTEDLVGLFHEARATDYRDLAERYHKVLQALERPEGRERVEQQLASAHRQYDKVRQLDFFAAPARDEVDRLREVIDMRLHPSAAPRSSEGPGLDLRQLQGRRWVTRPRPHVDRVASAWLIRRFIDPEAAFLFAEPDAFPADAIPFDAPGVDLGHDGGDCTFETLVKRAGLRDRRLADIAEIVHEADMRDGRFVRDEARGVDLVIRGLGAANADDHRVLELGGAIFEGLYAASDRRG